MKTTPIVPKPPPGPPGAFNMRPEIQQGPRRKKGLIAMHRHINTLTCVLHGAHEEEKYT